MYLRASNITDMALMKEIPLVREAWKLQLRAAKPSTSSN
jgi:hypothetical protein